MWAWVVAFGVYLGFRAWYDKWRGKLSAVEIADFVARAQAEGWQNRPAFEAFLAADDGRDFIMLNLVRIAPGMIAHPDTGAPTAGSEIFNRYSRPFLRHLLLRGGHPALVLARIAALINSVPKPDPTTPALG